MDEALTVSARHRRVDLGDHAAGDAQNRRRKVHGHTETDVASGIGRRHLKQGHVDRQPPARQEFRHLLERNRHVVELAAFGEALYVAADEERPMAVAGLGGARLHRQRRRGDEADELEVGRAGLHRLQPREQAARRSAPGAEIDAAARPDRRQRLLCANELQDVPPLATMTLVLPWGLAGVTGQPSSGLSRPVPACLWADADKRAQRQCGFLPISFSNFGIGCQALHDIIHAGSTVLSAVGASPPHDGIG